MADSILGGALLALGLCYIAKAILRPKSTPATQNVNQPDMPKEDEV